MIVSEIGSSDAWLRSRRLSNRRRAAARLLAGTCALGVVSAAQAASITRIEARLQQRPQARSATSITLGRRRISAEPLLIRVDGGSTASAFRLEPDASLSSTEVWSTAPLDTLGYHGLASAYWIATQAEGAGHPAPANLEFAAEQLAIWHFTDDLRLSADLRANKVVLRRAKFLASAAPPKVTSKLRARALNLTTSIESSNAQHVTIEVHVAANGGISLSRQTVYLRVDGVSACAITGESTTYHQLSHTVSSTLKACFFAATHEPRYIQQTAFIPHGNPDAAEVVLDRPRHLTEIAVDWALASDPGEFFVPMRGGPALMTRTAFDMDLGDTTSIDPSALPSASTLAQRSVEDWLLRILAWVGIPVFLLFVCGYLFLRRYGAEIGKWIHDRRTQRRQE